jgi:hypothetical protein
MEQQSKPQNPIIKRFLAVVSGLLSAGILVAVLESVLSRMFESKDAIIDYKNVEAVNQHMKSLPSSFFICLICVYIICGFVGGFVSTVIFKMNLLPAMIVSAVFGALTVGNMVSFYHPTWAIIAGTLFALVSPWIGGRFYLHRIANRNL